MIIRLPVRRRCLRWLTRKIRRSSAAGQASACLLLIVLALLAGGISRSALASTPEVTEPRAELERLVARGDRTSLSRLAQRLDAEEEADGERARAASLYCRAARLGDRTAARRLAQMFLEGDGVPQDTTAAARWLGVVQANDHPPHHPELQCTETAPRGTLVAAADSLISLVRSTAMRHGVDPELALALAVAESGLRADSVSPRQAKGVMQLMPGTAASLGVINPMDPRQNVDAGVRHLRRLIEKYRGDVRLALAAYNAGENAVDRQGGFPRIAETEAYVARVLSLWGRR